MPMSKGRVLVYRLGSLGDTIMALPAFNALRMIYPKEFLSLLTNCPVTSKAAPIQSVLGGHFFEDVISYPLGTRSPMEILRLILQIRGRGISTVVNLAAFRSDKSLKRDAIFFRLAGARVLHGFDLLPEDKFPRKDTRSAEIEWEARRLARRVATLHDIDLDVPAYWDLHIDENEKSEADSLLAALPEEVPIISLSVGTKVSCKHWGQAKWQELIRRLAGTFKEWALVFTGAEEEQAESEACMKYWSGPALNLCGLASPRTISSVYGRSKIFVGHDSGPMHLAACMGTPCVAIFSARNIPRQWFPRGQNNRIIYHRTDCAGCGLDVCIEEKKKCMESITVDEVLSAATDLLLK